MKQIANKYFFFLLFLFCLNLFKTYAQPKEYRQAIRMALNANELLIQGNLKEADSLIRLSIKTYPVLSIHKYARTLASLSDVKGANIIVDLAINTVKNISSSMIYTSNTLFKYYDRIPEILEDTSEMEKERLLFNFYDIAYTINKTYGNRNQIIISLDNLQIPIFYEKTDKKHPTDYELGLQKAYKLSSLIYKGNLDAALNNIEFFSKFYSTEEAKLLTIIPILIEKGDYNFALEKVKALEKNKLFIGASDVYKFHIYAKQGDRKAMSYYRHLPSYIKENNRSYYFLALIDLFEQKYDEAEKNLNHSVRLRSSKDTLRNASELVENWDLYKAYGDLYTGKKEYEKARDNYNISLLYYPEYEPTIQAITNLEMLVASEKANDKNAPIIVITSPSLNRGLKISGTGNELLVKGTAKDPSGLKSVTINGQEVYAQAGGDFWGNILVKEGNNSIMITATDKAGNSGNFQFDWSVQKPSANTETPIIAVNNQEGKNYCLLLASQNYSDNNIPSLENPISDAIKLKLVLKNNYSFSESNIISLFNPSNNDIKRQLLELTTQLQPEDNLVIFYAGHGIWVEKEKKGYWLMTDAKRNDVTSWLPNKEVLDLVAKIPSRHTLLITDACFSGSVFKTRGIKDDAPKAMKELDEKISRIAITSGNDTEVPDQSVFMKYLVKALSENKEKYLTAQKMFITQILEAVMTESKTEPRYGTLELAGHVGGDFIFSKK